MFKAHFYSRRLSTGSRWGDDHDGDVRMRFYRVLDIGQLTTATVALCRPRGSSRVRRATKTPATDGHSVGLGRRYIKLSYRWQFYVSWTGRRGRSSVARRARLVY